jgi:PadR family transcriptional regulator, regulatory protein PadR
MISEQSLLMLAAVAPSPLHGYGILKTVEELSDGRVVLRAGTLYAALDRLVGEGSLLVDREEIVDGRLRRYYAITEAGVAVLQNEAERLASDLKVTRRQLARRRKLGLT